MTELHTVALAKKMLLVFVASTKVNEGLSHQWYTMDNATSPGGGGYIIGWQICVEILIIVVQIDPNPHAIDAPSHTNRVKEGEKLKSTQTVKKQ